MNESMQLQSTDINPDVWKSDIELENKLRKQSKCSTNEIPESTYQDTKRFENNPLIRLFNTCLIDLDMVGGWAENEERDVMLVEHNLTPKWMEEEVEDAIERILSGVA